MKYTVRTLVGGLALTATFLISCPAEVNRTLNNTIRLVATMNGANEWPTSSQSA